MSGRILRNRDQARNAAALLVLAAHQISWAFGSDQYHVQILARLDLLEVHVEAVSEQQGRTGFEVRLELVVQRLLRHVGNQHGNQLGALDRRLGFHDFQAILFRLVPAVSLANADYDIEAAVVQIERVRPTLASVPENGDACPSQCFLVDVFLRIQTHVCSCNPVSNI